MESKFENRARIVNGPGKWELMLALFEKGKQVTFTIEFEGGRGVKTLFNTQINSIEAEDGSRESWNIRGGITGQSNFSREEERLTFPDGIQWRNFEAYFHSRTRSGNIRY